MIGIAAVRVYQSDLCQRQRQLLGLASRVIKTASVFLSKPSRVIETIPCSGLPRPDISER